MAVDLDRPVRPGRKLRTPIPPHVQPARAASLETCRTNAFAHRVEGDENRRISEHAAVDVAISAATPRLPGAQAITDEFAAGVALVENGVRRARVAAVDGGVSVSLYDVGGSVELATARSAALRVGLVAVSS